jgi:O-antigen/teichoic acid export membrane protein
MSTDPVNRTPTPTAVRSDLDRALGRGIAWNGALRWGAQVVTWASMLVVLRFVGPTDYGVISMVMTVVSLTAIITEFGLGQAVTALRRGDAADLRELNTVALGLGIVGTLAMAAGAKPLALFMGEPRLTSLAIALSVTLALDSLRIIPLARFALVLDYRRMAGYDVVKSITSSICVLAFAVAGFGSWSLAIGYIAASVTSAAIMLFRVPVGFAWPDRARVMPVIKYSATLLLARLSWYLYSNADFVTVGRVLGSAVLGQYAFAWTLASLPGEKLVNVVTAVTQPFFPAAGGDIVLIRGHILRLTRLLTMVVVPPLMVLLLIADHLIPLVFGAKWLPAVLPLRLLVFYHSVYASTIVCTQLLSATGRAKAMARTSTYALFFLLPAFAYGAINYGVIGVGVAWILVLPISVGWPLRQALRVIQTPARTYLAAWLPALTVSTIIAVVVSAFRLLPADAFSEVLLVIAQIVLASIVYVTFVWLRLREDLDWIRSIARKS